MHCVFCSNSSKLHHPHFFLAVPEEMRSNILERLSEHRRGRHDEALTSMYHELACIARVRLDFVIQIVLSL